MAREPWTATADGVVVDVRLTPRGRRDALDVAPRNVTIAAGATSRIKRVLIKGRTSAIVAALRRSVGSAE